MKWRRGLILGTLSAALVFPVSVHAAPGPEADPNHDARTEGYQNTVQIEGSTALLWIMFFFVSVLSMSALFKDSRRARTE